MGPSADPTKLSRIRLLAGELFAGAEYKKPSLGESVAMDDPEMLVLEESVIEFESGEKMRIAATTPQARPPFEWLYEISVDMGEVDYFKHYLVRDEDIVLAERKTLAPLDDQEADVLLTDLEAAVQAMARGAAVYAGPPQPKRRGRPPKKP